MANVLRHGMTTILVGWATAVMVAACGSTHAQEGGSPSPKIPSAVDVATLVANAERELAASFMLDYRAPRDRESHSALRRRASEFFYQACKRGDPSSCWRYAAIGGHNNEIAMEAARHCLAGHRMSCRALASYDLLFSFDYEHKFSEIQRMCHAGLIAACVRASIATLSDRPAEHRQWLQKACDLGGSASCQEAADFDKEAGKPENEVEALYARALDHARVECDWGYARSCLRLKASQQGSRERVEETALVGCRSGFSEDCSIFRLLDLRPEMRAHGLAKGCSLGKGNLCEELARLRTDPIEERDAREHGCQFGWKPSCLRLVRQYYWKELPEPVPGRGADLADYLCKEHQEAEACALVRK